MRLSYLPLEPNPPGVDAVPPAFARGVKLVLDFAFEVRDVSPEFFDS